MTSKYPSHVEAITPFGWYGGKTMDLQFVLPIIDIPHQIYVEPFGGSAAVLLHKEQSEVEVYNDVDERLITFFDVLRNRKEELIDQLRYTPYSRRAFERAVEFQDKGSEASDVEKARQFFISVQQSYSGHPDATKGRWGYTRKESRRGKSCVVNNWQQKIKSMNEVAERMGEVQIECKPAIDIIQRYDHEEALHYLDPPYIHESREQNSLDVYDTEMSEKDHRELLEIARGADGYVAISGYPNDVYEEELEEYGWLRQDKTASANTADDGQKERVECVWTNYDPEPVSNNE
ncbi:DNA adenine methylase [Natronococcus roseus]|uniref:DNA adenine methylase n=1 Tax=Natronococcus roseus TaxID=1052014 RepID=UPI00374D3406